MARAAWGVALAALAAACGGGSGGGAAAPEPAPVEPGPTPPSAPPITKDGFTFYGAAQGIPADVWDVSADEAGNVYVAAGDAVLAKRRDDAEFRRFDAASAGITRNCDEAKTVACPMVSVAGGAPGVAIVGLKGVGTDGDYDPEWQMDSGGADVLAFDGQRLSRTRHVLVGGVPERMCLDDAPPPCYDGDATWEGGRRKVRQVLRLAVNHAAGTVQYGDVWMAGTHGTFSVLVANPERRGWVDLTAQYPGTEDRRYVWEHDHPAITAWTGTGTNKRLEFLSGTSTALAIDPTTGDPWGANETRLASKRGYGARPDGWWAALWPPWRSGDEIGSFLDVWPDPRPADPYDFDALDPRWMDMVASLSFCDDGTLWIASLYHGLARRAPDGSIAYVSLPPDLGDSASAVACDPSDGSVWVGFNWGGFGRWNGSWWTLEAVSPPASARGPVRNIQIDRWASPRIVYFAHAESQLGPGGVTAYRGP